MTISIIMFSIYKPTTFILPTVGVITVYLILKIIFQTIHIQHHWGMWNGSY